MGPSFDGLLCDEVVFFEFETNDDQTHELDNDKDESFIDLPLLTEECLGSVIKRECEFLPNGDYVDRFKNGDLDLRARKEAVDWITEVHSHYNFGPLCAYLAVNYLDRYLSAIKSPGKAWSMQLLAVACLSIAAKMEETYVPLCLDLQVGESKFVFKAKTIMKMELLVLSTLKWRMQAITPFSFIDYFLNKINGDKVPAGSSIHLSTQLILNIIKGIDYLKFRPSEVAAAVAVSVKGETQTVDIEKSISALARHVQKEKLLECIELIHKLSLMCWPVTSPNASIAILPHCPFGVLDAASYKSDEKTVGSCSNSSQNNPHNKRRKLNMSCEVEI